VVKQIDPTPGEPVPGSIEDQSVTARQTEMQMQTNRQLILTG